jgi:hypothetical protein
MSSRRPRASFCELWLPSRWRRFFFDIPQGYKRSCAEKHAFRRFTRGLLGTAITARLWEAESGKLLATFQGHTDQVHSAPSSTARR